MHTISAQDNFPDCIRQEVEQLVDSMCGACGAAGMIKKTALRLVPEVLIVQIAKYSAPLTGIQQTISFATAGENNGKDYICYKLVAVISHYGDADSGHYNSKCLRRDDSGKISWYAIDDAGVQVIGEDSDHSAPIDAEASFLLFYCYTHIAHEN